MKGSFYKGPLSEAYKANGAALRTEAQMKLNRLRDGAEPRGSGHML